MQRTRCGGSSVARKEKRENPKAATSSGILVNDTQLAQASMPLRSLLLLKATRFFFCFVLFLSWENSSYFNLGFTWAMPGRCVPDSPATISLSEVGMSNCSATQPSVQHNKPIDTAGFLLRDPSQAPRENSSQR